MRRLPALISICERQECSSAYKLSLKTLKNWSLSGIGTVFPDKLCD